jgi:hypothetical protein
MMIYDPTINNEWEWQSVDRLLLSDPVLYAWIHWEVANARAIGLKIDMSLNFAVATVTAKEMFGFKLYARGNNPPFVYPPV